ncbi:unnamed protein product [Fraxinus pennsylvanica]|uniref:Syntaxin 6/10/61 N-terminal domain-containing protein n=1 Tax=Fraxinus pennsylvanica TaxID=56036 RepID=A0AAD2DQS5_9LAMI|nr:unnamed protein product [Fraxinus pennsylvanica]
MLRLFITTAPGWHRPDGVGGYASPLHYSNSPSGWICFTSSLQQHRLFITVAPDKEGKKGKMLVADSFDLWQKDTFFSAAEEVQQSADIMESAYRTWLRAKKEGMTAQNLDELSRELQMALGTAKWQLEEFERAVRLSYRIHAAEVTKTRHRQFVSVIEDQISRVEAALKESYNVDRNQHFSWVNLNEEERDDLALFLSGTADNPHTKLGEPATSPFKEKNNARIRLDSKVGSKAQIPIKTKGFEEIVTSNVEAKCFIEAEEKEIPETRDEPSSRRARNLPGVSALEIVIDIDNEERNTLVEATPKEKASKPYFWRSRCEDHPQAKGGVFTYTQLKILNFKNQLFKRTPRSQRQQQISPKLSVDSIRLVLALMLTLFLVVQSIYDPYFKLKIVLLFLQCLSCSIQLRLEVKILLVNKRKGCEFVLMMEKPLRRGCLCFKFSDISLGEVTSQDIMHHVAVNCFLARNNIIFGMLAWILQES